MGVDLGELGRLGGLFSPRSKRHRWKTLIEASTRASQPPRRPARPVAARPVPARLVAARLVAGWFAPRSWLAGLRPARGRIACARLVAPALGLRPARGRMARAWLGRAPGPLGSATGLWPRGRGRWRGSGHARWAALRRGRAGSCGDFWLLRALALWAWGGISAGGGLRPGVALGPYCGAGWCGRTRTSDVVVDLSGWGAKPAGNQGDRRGSVMAGWALARARPRKGAPFHHPEAGAFRV